MELIIENNDSLNLDDFMSWLVKQIKHYIINSIDKRRSSNYDELINSKLIKWDYYKNYAKASTILEASVYHIKWKKYLGRYIIYLDPSAIIPQSNAKFIDIINYINYGNLNTPAYPIYSDAFNYFDKNIKLYLDDYLKE